MLETGSIVIATAGRDKDAYFVVAGEKDGKILLCDGKRRLLDRPKRKNPCHVKPMDDSFPMEDIKTNRALRRRLTEYAARRESSAN